MNESTPQTNSAQIYFIFSTSACGSYSVNLLSNVNTANQQLMTSLFELMIKIKVGAQLYARLNLCSKPLPQLPHHVARAYS